MATNPFQKPYTPDPTINFPQKLWSNPNELFQRLKQGKEVYEAVMARCNKNWLAEKGWFDNVKSRKFSELTIPGSYTDAWNILKDSIVTMESASQKAEQSFKTYYETTKTELDLYAKQIKTMEDTYNKVTKKRTAHRSEVEKKKDKYFSLFKEWDELENDFSHKRQANPSSPELAKLEKAVGDKERSMRDAEDAYIQSVTQCQQSEKDWDEMLISLLQEAEALEINRIDILAERMKAVVDTWTETLQVKSSMAERAYQAVNSIKPTEDIKQWVDRSFKPFHRPPYATAKIPSRIDGSPYPSPNLPNPPTQIPVHFPTSATAPPPFFPDPIMFVQHEYRAEGDTDINCAQGEQVTVLNITERASGWAQVKTQSGRVGFVPFTYLADTAPGNDSTAQSVGHTSKTRGVIMTDFQGQSESELSVFQGDVVEYTDDGTEWCYCTKESDGLSGFVPTTYIQSY
ncbi:hypothetical protein BLNAU_2153 [Blattamonas nauphoetae]|uniref:SH3 domain-containing protein n=1 Tax=Blattamonas nauphoetae TaxID=2049346 RepID=A0ABQ9YGC0_9EUKA|nr:hypothetical protein BLNAU_2153 [Blattamonas nauphoetae]